MHHLGEPKDVESIQREVCDTIYVRDIRWELFLATDHFVWRDRRVLANPKAFQKDDIFQDLTEEFASGDDPIEHSDATVRDQETNSVDQLQTGASEAELVQEPVRIEEWSLRRS